ncbi:unnamed protein product [Closterium sp. NIES-65]|nr:unnamed protein product [Closterium sp. NIES-65]
MPSMPRLGMFWAAAIGVGVVTCAVVFVRQKSPTFFVNLTADGTPGRVFSRGPFRVVEDSVRPRDCSFAQMYSILAGFDTLPEMRDAVKVINWLHANLHTLIDARIKPAALAAIRAAGKEAGREQAAGEETVVVSQPDWSRLVLAGHSRGGKVTFGILRKLVGELVKSTKQQQSTTQQRGFIEAQLAVPIKAAILFDPVDGTASKATNPPTLTHQPDSIALLNNPPVLVIGSGLGPIPRGGKSPSDKGNPCAPENFGHKVFFSDLVGPAYHFSVPEFGHADFYDDDLGPIYGPLFSKVCNNGPAREPMRVAAGGLSVAFLKAVVGDGGDGEKGGTVRGVRGERSGMEVERRDSGGVGGGTKSLEKRQALERLVTDAAADVADVATAVNVAADVATAGAAHSDQEQGTEQMHQQEQQEEVEKERQRLEGEYLRSGGSGGACGGDTEGSIAGGSAVGNREGGCGAVIGSGKGSDVRDLCDLLQHPEHSPVVLSEVGWKVGRQQETPEETPVGAPANLCGAAPATVAAAAAR